MFRKTRNDVPVHIQDVLGTDIVVIAYNIIGNIKNCQDVSFQRMLRKHMTGLLKTS
ncbi:MAG: hypothetical protein KAR03_10300 [Candidatus Thorarchaeota archaeon]|nr:hypothetical protein [Candidatus Thorarchaeota archaeon]